MNPAKYIRFDNGTFIIFSASLIHKDVADALEKLVGTPVSAGLFAAPDGKPKAGEGSMTLKLPSKKDDAGFLMRQIDPFASDPGDE